MGEGELDGERDPGLDLGVLGEVVGGDGRKRDVSDGLGEGDRGAATAVGGWSSVETVTMATERPSWLRASSLASSISGMR